MPETPLRDPILLDIITTIVVKISNLDICAHYHKGHSCTKYDINSLNISHLPPLESLISVHPAQCHHIYTREDTAFRKTYQTQTSHETR